MDRIEFNPAIQHGKPVIKGTRVPVVRILGELARGTSMDEIRKDYDLTQKDISAALQYAIELVEEEQVYPASVVSAKR